MRTLLKKTISLLFIFAIIVPFNTQAQWQQAEGLDGGMLTTMVSIDSMLFAIVPDKGVYSKSDSGVWELSKYDPEIYSLGKAGKCLFAYRYPYGYDDYCFRSFDYGESWEMVNKLTGSNNICNIDTTIFFQKNGKLYRSFNYGDSIKQLSPPFQFHYHGFHTDSNILFVHYNFYETNELYFSTNLGETWTFLPNTGLPDSNEMPYYEVEQMIVVNGDFWIQLQTQTAPYNDNMLFIYNPDQMKWIDVTPPQLINNYCTDLFEYKQKAYCSYLSYPVMEFNFEDSTWYQFDDGSKEVRQFLIHNEALFCATDQGACSLDSIGNWSNYYLGLDSREVTSLSILNDTIYAIASNELFFSADFGESFTQIKDAWGHQIITTDTIFYMISYHFFKMSNDKGKTWQYFSDSLNGSPLQRVKHLSISPGYYYLGTYEGLYRSSSDSISWTRHGHGYLPHDCNIYNVEAIQRTVFVGTATLYGSQKDLYFSNYYGNTFYYYDEACPFKNVRNKYCMIKDSLYFADFPAVNWTAYPRSGNFDIKTIDKVADTIVAGGKEEYIPGSAKLELTLDGGENWYSIIDNLPLVRWYELSFIQAKFFKNRFFVGNPQNGLWYRDDLITKNDEQLVLDTLTSNPVKVYPNPCKSKTKISFSNTSNSKNIIVNILDNSFKIVKTFNLKKKAKGLIEIEWNTQAYKPGLYYYQVIMDKKQYTGKIVVL